MNDAAVDLTFCGDRMTMRPPLVEALNGMLMP
jgi:hypothetical protein